MTGVSIVIATDKFKGTMTALQAAEAVRDGIAAQFRTDAGKAPSILLRPMADGGEGSMGVMERALHEKGLPYRKEFIESVNHLGSPILAPVLLYDNDGTCTAFIEMASVCGLNMVPRQKRDILRSTTYGLGTVMRSVIESYGARKIFMAIGGSGTNDGGFGMLAALGWTFSNSSPFRNRDIPSFLSGISSASDSAVQSVCPHLKETEITVASDVTSPLLGPAGATAVFGPQKGCRKQDIPVFEKALENWQSVIGYPDFPGAGAAGGIGYALKAALGATFVPGWEFFATETGLEQDIAAAGLVITGEGRFDTSSLSGKLPSGIASICRKYGKPLWVVTGQNRVSEAAYRSIGVTRVLELSSMALPGESPSDDAPSIIRRIFTTVNLHL